MTTYVVLPAYNEAQSLPNLLDRFGALDAQAKADLRLVVVDDGSTDGTSSLAREHDRGLALRVVEHEVNRGLGQAVQTGIRFVIDEAQPDDALVIMDADDTHDPALAIVLAQRLGQGADIVIASRFVDGGDDATAPLFRRILSRGAALCFRFALPIDRRVKDFTSGFRAYRVSMLERASTHWGERLIEERGFACMVELLLKLRYCNPVIAEVPLLLEYDRKQSPSKIKILRTIVQYLNLAARDRLSPAPYRQL